MSNEEVKKRMSDIEGRYKYLTNILSESDAVIADLAERLSKQRENRLTIQSEIIKLDREYTQLEKMVVTEDPEVKEGEKKDDDSVPDSDK